MSKEKPKVGDMFIRHRGGKNLVCMVGPSNTVIFGDMSGGKKAEEDDDLISEGTYIGNIKQVWGNMCTDIVKQYELGNLR